MHVIKKLSRITFFGLFFLSSFLNGADLSSRVLNSIIPTLGLFASGTGVVMGTGFTRLADIYPCSAYRKKYGTIFYLAGGFGTVMSCYALTASPAIATVASTLVISHLSSMTKEAITFDYNKDHIQYLQRHSELIREFLVQLRNLKSLLLELLREELEEDAPAWIVALRDSIAMEYVSDEASLRDLEEFITCYELDLQEQELLIEKIKTNPLSELFFDEVKNYSFKNSYYPALARYLYLHYEIPVDDTFSDYEELSSFYQSIPGTLSESTPRNERIAFIFPIISYIKELAEQEKKMSEKFFNAFNKKSYPSLSDLWYRSFFAPQPNQECIKEQNDCLICTEELGEESVVQLPPCDCQTINGISKAPILHRSCYYSFLEKNGEGSHPLQCLVCRKKNIFFNEPSLYQKATFFLKMGAPFLGAYVVAKGANYCNVDLPISTTALLCAASCSLQKGYDIARWTNFVDEPIIPLPDLLVETPSPSESESED